MKIQSAIPAVDFTADELQETLRPIASLISKSEKAQQKLAPGTWQHAMLRDNLQALRLASALLHAETDGATNFARDDMQAALRALASMIGKTEKAQTQFSPGTSPSTLLRNRLQALRLAEARIKVKLDKG
jgi:hypothetical protein